MPSLRGKSPPPPPPPTTVYHHQGRSVPAPKVSGPQVSVFHSPRRGSQICFHYMGIFFSSETTHPRPNQPFSTLSGFLKEIIIYVSIFISHKSLEDSQTNICQKQFQYSPLLLLYLPVFPTSSVRLSYHESINLHMCGFFIQHF